MASCALDLWSTFKLSESTSTAAREGEYPRLSTAHRLLLAVQIARIDGITVDEAHRQIHEQLRIW